MEHFPPVISVPNVDDGAFYNRDLTPKISIKSSSLTSTAITLDDRPYIPDTPVISEGMHKLKVTAEDQSGSRSSLQLSFTIDKTPPTSILQPSAFLKGESGAIFVTGSAQLAVTAEDKGIYPSGLASTECRLDGGNVQPYTQPIGMSGLTDGTHTLYCHSSDRAGNQEAEQKLTVIVNNSPPTTVLTLSPPHRSMPDGSYMASPTTVLNLFASGSPSGIAKTEYQIDGGPWQSAAPFTISTEGAHTIRFRSMDRLGNKEEPKSASVSIDKKPPLTEIQIDGIFTGAGKTLYASAAATFRLSAASPVIGILKSEYRIDNRQWTNYKPFTIDSEGKHLVEFRSIDAVGNTEPTHARYVTIDATPPLTAAAVDGQPVSSGKTHYTRGSNTITLKATDKLSGIKTSEYRIDEGTWQPYAPITLETKETHRVDYRSTDNVGNVEEINTISIQNDQTPPVSTLEAGIPKVVVEGILHVTEKTILTISAIDSASGVAKLEYRIDGGTWQIFAPFRIGTAGDHQIEFRSIDTVGNVEQPKSLQVKVGEGAPRTTVIMSDGKVPVDGDIYSTDKVPVILSASSKVWELKKTEYRTNGGPWNDYKTPIVIEEEGKHLLEFRSVDVGGNEEPIQSVAVIIDRAPPTSTLLVGSPKREVDGAVQIEAGTILTPTATDNLSGVDKFEYQIKGHGIESDGIAFSIATRGRYEINYWSIDKAGNKSTPQKLTVVVTAAPRQFSPEDLLLANEIASPPEIRKEAPASATDTLKAATDSALILPDLPPEEEPMPREKPEDRSLIYWTLGILQVGLILAVMLF